MSSCRSRVLVGRRGALHGKYSPAPAAASIRILLVTAVAKDGELRHSVRNRHS